MRHEPSGPCHLSQDINAEECPSPELQKCAIQQAVAVPYWLSHLQIPGHLLLNLFQYLHHNYTGHACDGARISLQPPDLRRKHPKSTRSLKAPFIVRSHPGGPKSTRFAEGTVRYTVSPWRPTGNSARVLSLWVFHGRASDALLTAH